MSWVRGQQHQLLDQIRLEATQLSSLLGDKFWGALSAEDRNSIREVVADVRTIVDSMKSSSVRDEEVLELIRNLDESMIQDGLGYAPSSGGIEGNTGRFLAVIEQLVEAKSISDSENIDRLAREAQATKEIVERQTSDALTILGSIGKRTKHLNTQGMGDLG